MVHDRMVRRKGIWGAGIAFLVVCCTLVLGESSRDSHNTLKASAQDLGIPSGLLAFSARSVESVGLCYIFRNAESFLSKVRPE